MSVSSPELWFQSDMHSVREFYKCLEFSSMMDASGPSYIVSGLLAPALNVLTLKKSQKIQFN